LLPSNPPAYPCEIQSFGATRKGPMNIRKDSTVAILSTILAMTALFCAPPALHAQLSDLPFKPGLWETTVSVNHAAPIPGHYCFTAGTTLGDYLTATNKGAPGTQCTIANKVQAGSRLSVDTACTGPSMSSKGHIDFQMPDAEHFTGTSHTTLTPQNMTIDKSFTAKFVASDCGSVKPVVVPASPHK